MSKKPATFPLRLPITLRQQVVDLAVREGLSLNQFISLAVAKEIARLEQSTRLKDKQTNVLSLKQAGEQ